MTDIDDADVHDTMEEYLERLRRKIRNMIQDRRGVVDGTGATSPDPTPSPFLSTTPFAQKVLKELLFPTYPPESQFPQTPGGLGPPPGAPGAPEAPPPGTGSPRGPVHISTQIPPLPPMPPIPPFPAMHPYSKPALQFPKEGFWFRHDGPPGPTEIHFAFRPSHRSTILHPSRPPLISPTCAARNVLIAANYIFSDRYRPPRLVSHNTRARFGVCINCVLVYNNIYTRP